ncbi:MAG TPA: flavin reductase family protein [Bordetella sp.]
MSALDNAVPRMAETPPACAFDSRELRRTLGAFTTGVTVMTTLDAAGNLYGVTANSFSSVSLDPPFILWSQALTSSSYPAFRDCERFVVNILADHQIHVSNQFARSGGDKFRGIAVREGLGGVPIIDDCAAHLECAKVAAYPGGDHVVYLGQVERIHRGLHRPLAFGDGRYVVPVAHETAQAAAAAR